MPTATLEDVQREVDQLNRNARNANELMRDLVKLLHEKLLKYNWVGFYMLEPGAKPPMLALGAYQGAMTPHTRIPFFASSLARLRVIV